MDAFFALLKAGLWEDDVELNQYGDIDFDALYQVSENQCVTGLVAAGLEHVKDRRITKSEAIPFLKKVFSIEHRNVEMNRFISSLFIKMSDNNVYTLLVKGQGIAQCYERPLWRVSGDIDLFLDSINYEKAKQLFSKEIEFSDPEGKYAKHQGMSIGSWTVELHGTLRCGLSSRIDRTVDDIQSDIFNKGRARAWRNGGIDAILPVADDDVLLVFTHFLKHFYKGGIGLRQICDWCRLLWTYRDSIDISLLEDRLKKMRLMSEWRAFAAFAVDSLGMPVDALPLYDSDHRWARKASRIQSFILEVGNFGNNRDMSYYQKYPYLLRKMISFGRRCGDFFQHMLIFPLDSLLFFSGILFHGIGSAVRGE